MIDDAEARFARVRTPRLVLRVPDPADVTELFALYAHPEVWRHDPVTRHVDDGQSARMIERWRAGWAAGLGMWVARLPDGDLVGIGGCFVRHGVAWNLGYRLMPEFWGQGYAQEIIAAAVDAARTLRPDLPMTAYLLDGNDRSRRATERAGLRLVWRGPDANNPDPAAVRLLYADRSLDDALIRLLTAD